MINDPIVYKKIGGCPIGSIVFSMSKDTDDGWLLCDGSFVSSADYPELISAMTELPQESTGMYLPNLSVGGIPAWVKAKQAV